MIFAGQELGNCILFIFCWISCVSSISSTAIIISFLYARFGLYSPSGHVATALSVVLQHAVGVRYFVFHQSGEVPGAALGLRGWHLYSILCSLSYQPSSPILSYLILNSSAIICCCSLTLPFGGYAVFKRKRVFPPMYMRGEQVGRYLRT